MKKICKHIILSILVIVLCSCGNNEEKGTIEKCVASYLNENFEYYKTTNYVDENGENKQLIVKGTYVANPYQETIEVVEGKENNPWDKAIYAGEGELVTAKIYVQSEWTETTIKREYPYGYGEELAFEFVCEEKVDDVLCEVYTTQYTVELGDNVFIDDEIFATVSQTYYMAKDAEVLIRIDTDLTDLNEKTYICNDILTNGKTLEEAKERAKKIDDFSKTEEVRIVHP